MKKAISLFSVAALLIALRDSAAAVNYQYQFAGTVTTVPPALASQFSPNEVIRGSMTITPTVFLPDHGGGQISNFTANIGGDYPITANLGGFDILNDFGGSIDQVKLEVSTFFGMVASPVAGHTPESLSFNLLYNSSTHLTSSNFLPRFIFSSPNDRSGLRFDGNDALTVGFHLTDLSMVPEPSSAFLAVTAIALIAAGHRRPERRNE